MLEEMRRGLGQKILAKNMAELGYLETRMFFLRGVSMTASITAIGWTQEFNGATGMKWRLQHVHTDGVSLQNQDTYS